MKREIETLFYTESQNNSGGYFKYDEESGIGEYIIIEVANKKDTNGKLESITCGYDSYCECCGERWSGYVFDDEFTDIPKIYSEEVNTEKGFRGFSTTHKYSVFIHNLDGTITKIKNTNYKG